MSLLSKALRTVTQLGRKNPTPDVAATIRSALSAAGLDPGAQPVGIDPLGCMAPVGAAMVLKNAMPRWGRAPEVEDEQSEADGQGSFTWHSIADGRGHQRRYKLFVPGGAEPPVGLLVMLHGCSQNPDDFALGTRMNAVAAEHNVLVAYPEQIRSANVSLCWNWFDSAHQRSGSGEPGLIAAITRAIMAEHAIPPGRVFVAGLSAGGAMAAVMAHAESDLFGAVGIHSGLPYLAASDVPSAFAAMRGDAPAEVVAGRAVFPGVPAIIFHGDADRTVHVSNADAMVARLSDPALAVTVEHGASADGKAYVRTIAGNPEGVTRFESWRLAGAGHAWSGGSRAGSYADPSGPDASREMMRFFLEQARHPSARTDRLVTARA
jgi:poly(hydroxyalkanoate) depolymerase family esterase